MYVGGLYVTSQKHNYIYNLHNTAWKLEYSNWNKPVLCCETQSLRRHNDLGGTQQLFKYYFLFLYSVLGTL